MYVSDDASLRRLVDQISGSPIVAVDTEFMREKTYFARLCLIQLATDDVAAIVDPIAIRDITPLCAVFSDPGVVKVLHAGGQDLEIFYRVCGHSLSPIFDTQIAATLAGFPQQVGYGALVHELLGVKLDKGDSYTDWGRRPLTDNQIEYALNDVIYLPEVYRRLSEQLEGGGRTQWLAADFKRLEDPATYEIEPRDQWKRVKRISSLNRRQLAVAREVAAWREIEAMRRDAPKRWVLGDESIVEIARRMPTSATELGDIRGVSDKVGKGAVRGILDAVVAGVAVPECDLPSLPKKKRLNGDVDGAIDLMVALVRLRAREHGVAMPLLAAREDIERLAGGEREGSPLLEGWRGSMVGNELVDLIEGRLSLTLVDGQLKVLKI